MAGAGTGGLPVRLRVTGVGVDRGDPGPGSLGPEASGGEDGRGDRGTPSAKLLPQSQALGLSPPTAAAPI